MSEQFTGDARQVVVRASEQARRLGHRFIGGEHLLYGLASDQGEVGAVLRERGVTPERVEAAFGPAALALVAPAASAPRRWLRSRPGWDSGPVTGHMPLTRRAKKCLDGSLREAQAHPGGDRGAKHIALALLAMDEGVPPRILSAIGASAPRLGAEIRERCRKAG